uniref:Uncharacterized protein n=1 Tax=Clytia hemisphaerica TaxID=252671 RepID=A0A7M5UII3_9CNID
MKECEKFRIWYHDECERLISDSEGKITCKRCSRLKTSKTTNDKAFILAESRDSRQNATENELEITSQHQQNLQEALRRSKEQFEIETAFMESIKIIMRERNFKVTDVTPD